MYNAVPRKVALSDFKRRQKVDDEENTINYYDRDYGLLLSISNRDCIIFAVISFSDFKEDYGLGDDCPFPFFFLPLTKGAINTLWMNRNHFQLKYLTYLAPNSVNQIRQR